MPRTPGAKNDTSEVEFVNELPETVRAKVVGRSEAIAAKLRARPTVWARVGVKGTYGSAHGMASRIRQQRGPFETQTGWFEAVVHTGDDETIHEVFARYMPNEDDE